MTRRERLEMVIAGNITDELIEECKAEIEKMDTANAKRKEKENPHKAENASIMENIMGVVANSDEPILVSRVLGSRDSQDREFLPSAQFLLRMVDLTRLM